jgi:DtxR family transcriptional regulator, Mn-dependent transcriptional regulator
MSGDLSAAAQDYLKQIYKLQARHGRASTSAIAERMNVTPASVSGMLKKLAALDLIVHERYHGVRLTSAGERAAIQMIRRHRLIEDYLSRRLGLPIDALHAEADRLEHALSEDLAARIDESLGHPTHDPHGDPIPSDDLLLEPPSPRRLSDLEPGQSATVCHVPDGDAALLRHLADLKLLPGARVEIVQAAPFGGPLTIRSGASQCAISRELARRLDVH